MVRDGMTIVVMVKSPMVVALFVLYDQCLERNVLLGVAPTLRRRASSTDGGAEPSGRAGFEVWLHPAQRLYCLLRIWTKR